MGWRPICAANGPEVSRLLLRADGRLKSFEGEAEREVAIAERELHMCSLKIGVALWTLGPTRTEDELRRSLDAAAGLGVKAVQPWCVDNGPEHPCVLDPGRCVGAKRAEARKMIEERGLVVSGLCAQLAGPTTFGGFGEQVGLDERVEKTKKSLELAADLGGPVVTTHVGVIPDDRDDPLYQVFLHSCSQVAQHAEKVGAAFAPETGQERNSSLTTWAAPARR